MRLRLVGEPADIAAARKRRATMALPRGARDGASASEHDPTPTVVRRSDAEIRRMQSEAEQAAGIGRNEALANGAEFAPPDTHAEGFLCAIAWFLGHIDDTSVTLNWWRELP